MNTHEASIDLSLFLPENFPSQQELELMLAGAYNCVPARAGVARTARALLHLTGGGSERWYDHQHRGLGPAISDGKYDCLTSTAFVCLVGRLICGVDVIPTMRKTRLSKDAEANDYDFHAFAYFRDSTGEIVISGSTEFSTLSPNESRERPSPSELFIHKNRNIFDGNDVIQLREHFDGSTDTFQNWYTKDEYDPWETKQVDTFFCGNEGLKSFLSTVEFISAKTNQREPEILPGQLIPRI